VLQAPDVTLKMSTALEGPPSAAQGMRLAHAISKPTPVHSTIPLPNPHNTIRNDMEINMATRTSTTATSKDRDSDTRQRCRCKNCSTYAESCCAPGSRCHVVDVNSIGGGAVLCARRETCTRNQQTNPRPLNHHITQPAQHNTQRERYGNKHRYTYQRHQRRSQLRHSAAMWLQDNIELR
jgi:hypothetical protein